MHFLITFFIGRIAVIKKDLSNMLFNIFSLDNCLFKNNTNTTIIIYK